MHSFNLGATTNITTACITIIVRTNKHCFLLYAYLLIIYIFRCMRNKFSKFGCSYSHITAMYAPSTKLVPLHICIMGM